MQKTHAKKETPSSFDDRWTTANRNNLFHASTAKKTKLYEAVPDLHYKWLQGLTPSVVAL